MSASVKERPILFSGPMVKAILEGRKSQTRRAVKPQPAKMEHVDYDKDRGWHLWWDVGTYYGDHDQHYHDLRCPYGEPGDHLWLRETWSPDHSAFYPNYPVVYRADGCGPFAYEVENGRVYSDEQKAWYPFRWRPSIFMPRHYSRITLEVTGVRVEQLTSISSADCVAEGIAPAMRNDPPAKDRYRDLWDQINGKRPGCSWADNPWVWAVEFRLIESPQHI